MKRDTLAEGSDQLRTLLNGGIEALAREGARKMLKLAMELEIAEYVEAHAKAVDGNGRRLVVRNGHKAERVLLTGVGPVPIQQPRVNDRRPGEKFSSRLLPAYARRAPSLNTAIPVLYLLGISTGDMREALAALVGEEARNLSESVVLRLKEQWEKEYEEWNQRRLEGEEFVYWWVDAIHTPVRLSDERPCVLVIMGATSSGQKKLVALVDGQKESKLSWMDVLRDLKKRGLKQAPKVAVGDGALGFWGALAEVLPETRIQRCWVHKTCNVLDKLPKREHPSAKSMLHDIWMARTRKQALAAWKDFLDSFGEKYPKACECLEADKDELLAFYDFPAAHWVHLRTTNPIESTFASIRLRHRKTKGNGSRKATLAMLFKLALEAEKGWRKLNAPILLLELLRGQIFVDGDLKKVA
jgi:putative transposase